MLSTFTKDSVTKVIAAKAATLAIHTIPRKKVSSCFYLFLLEETNVFK